MGQRHQVFIVTKADGRHRTLAANHQQWSYGLLALQRCRAVMKRCQANASLLRYEISKAEKLDWQKEVEAKDIKDSQRNLLFPIATTCLLLAVKSRHIEPINILPTQCDNNDGITVIDITDPEESRYAFVSLPDSEHKERVTRMMPMNAIEYLKIYEKRWKFSPELREVVDEFKELPLIDAETLHSTWPELEFCANKKHESQRRDATEKDGATGAEWLRKNAMQLLISHGFKSDVRRLSWFEHASQLPDFSENLRDTMDKQPQLLDEPAGLALLERSIQDGTVMDLRRFSTIKPQQILELLQKAKQKVVVSLPDMPELSVDDLTALLDTGMLLELHMGETPNIELQCALDAISGKSLDLFTHPNLFRLAIEQTYVNPLFRKLPNFPVGVETGFPISQVLFMQRHYERGEPVHRLENDTGLAWTQTVYKESDNEPIWDAYRAPRVFPFPLRGSLLTLDRLLEQLPGVVADLSGREQSEFQTFFNVGRVGQEVVLEHIASRIDDRILPIPAECFHMYRCYGEVSGSRPPTPEPIRAGEWTMLALHEASFEWRQRRWDVSKLRYAFVTLDDEEQLKVLSVRELEKLLRTGHELYRPNDVATRANLVETFEDRMKSTAENQRTEVSSCSVAEAGEAVDLAARYRDQAEQWVRKHSRMQRIWYAQYYGEPQE